MRHDIDSFLTYADIEGYEQEGIYEGQIRYKLTLTDVALDSREYEQIRDAARDNNRVEIIIRVLDLQLED